MSEWFNEFLYEDPFLLGLIILLVAIGYLIYKIDKKESFNMHKHSAAGWKALVYSWVVLFMLIIFGLSLIIKNY
jgi:hypothetical protein